MIRVNQHTAAPGTSGQFGYKYFLGGGTYSGAADSQIMIHSLTKNTSEIFIDGFGNMQYTGAAPKAFNASFTTSVTGTNVGDEIIMKIYQNGAWINAEARHIVAPLGTFTLTGIFPIEVLNLGTIGFYISVIGAGNGILTNTWLNLSQI